MGRLTPCFIQEAIPSDYFVGSSEMLVRLAPLLAPIYDQIQVYVHFFFVPNRLLWEDWEEFITGGRLGVGVDPVTAPVPPYIDLGANMTAYGSFFEKSSLADYLGCPPWPFTGEISSDYDGIQLDMMPFLAYQKVWYDFYRDRNYVSDDFMTFPFPSGAVSVVDAGEYLSVQLRNYKHDYFTSALLFTQRGEEVVIPVEFSGYAPVVVDPVSPPTTNALVNGTEDGGAVAWSVGVDANVPSSQDMWANMEGVDIAQTTTINDFRSAYALQVWLERNAIGGSRYVESIQAHFGPGLAKDPRLQRAEYIGGGRIPVKISEVVSTAFSSDGTDIVPLANMGGHGVTYGNTNRFKYFCPEHGFIIGMLSIMNPPSYHQGLPRMFRRKSFLDYPWPTFAKLGEQTVSVAELYANAVNLTENVDGELPLFGYQSRYADWKYVPNTSHGDFHDTLLFWTLTRTFTSAPALVNQFVLFDDESQDRIFAVNGEADNFWLYVHNRVTVKRPLPYFGTPNTLGFV